MKKLYNCPPGTSPSPVAPGQCVPNPKRPWRKGRKSKTGSPGVMPTYNGRSTTHSDRLAALNNAITRELVRRRALTGCCG